MTASDLLDGGFAILKSRPAAVFGACALIIIPLHALQAFLQRSALGSESLNLLFNDFSTGTSRSTTAGPSGGDILSIYGGIFLGTLPVYFVGAVIARLVSAWYAGGDLSTGETMKAVFKASPVILALWFLELIPNAVSLFGCIGWFFLNPLFLVAVPVAMIEGAGPIKAISRSVQLVSRRYLWVCLYAAAVWFMAYLARNALTLIPQALGVALPSPWNWIAFGAGQTLVELILVPAVAGVSVLLYLDLRIRSEGLDLELKAADAFASAA